MAFQFPDNPTLGDTYQDYTWVGSYWSRISQPDEGGPEISACSSDNFIQAPSANPIGGNNNTMINLTIPIDLGQLLHGANHAHSDFDYLAPE